MTGSFYALHLMPTYSAFKRFPVLCAHGCRSDTKFDSGCGWPAFYAEVPGSVDRHVDRSFGTTRTEITCANCGGHLGHVFEGEVRSGAFCCLPSGLVDVLAAADCSADNNAGVHKSYGKSELCMFVEELHLQRT